MILRLQASAGLTGVGDASQSSNGKRMLEFASQFFDAIKGRSVYEIERLCAIAMPVAKRSGLSAAVAMSALEQCLWDMGLPCLGQQ